MPRKCAPGRRARAGQQTLSRSFAGFLQVRPERRELPGPQGIRLRQPRLQLRHSLGTQPVDTDPRIEFIAVLVDEPALAQRLEMTAHCGKGDVCRLRELSCTMWPLAQQVDDPPAVRVGERREGPVEPWRAQSG